MQVPDSFEDKLRREFRGRLRIRWSGQRGEWHIEQRVSRGLFPGTKPSRQGWDESVDAYVRHRDGYIFVMAVRTGDRMPCPRCGHTLKVPYMQTTHIKCDYCRLTGRTTHVAAVYFPLSDSLIEHLKKIDPENPISERLGRDVERQNDALAASMERDAVREAEGAFEDDYRRLVGIPTAHLSGRTRMWVGK